MLLYQFSDYLHLKIERDGMCSGEVPEIIESVIEHAVQTQTLEVHSEARRDVLLIERRPQQLGSERDLRLTFASRRTQTPR